MNRKFLLVFVLGLTFLLAVSACSKKKVAEAPATTPEPVQTPVEEPVVETTSQETEITPSAMAVLEDVYFAFDKYDLTAESRQTLENNARQLQDAGAVNIIIEGHCDERGTTEYNLALGERRAKAARDFLKSLGVADSRMEIISYGEERPFDPGHDEDAWSKNRRAHFVVKS